MRSEYAPKARVLGAVLSAVLLLIGALHLSWTVSTWPLSRGDFARLVVGVPVERLPSAGLTAAVAVSLMGAAWLVGVVAGVLPGVGPQWLWPVGAGVVGGVLLLRGAGGLVADALGQLPGDFVRLDRIVYSPLCLVLGLGTCWLVARRRRLQA